MNNDNGKNIERLDGPWYCQFGEVEDVADIRIADLPVWRKVFVPKPLNEILGLSDNWEGDITYARVFPMPELQGGQALILCLTGIYPGGDIFLNGKKVGSTSSGFAFNHFDLTPFLLHGENLLVIRIRSFYSGENARPSTPVPLGIWAPVWFEIRPHVFLQAVQVKSEVDGSWQTELHFSKPLPGPVTVMMTLIDPTGHKTSRLEAQLKSCSEVFKLPGKRLNKVQLWDFNYPSMYRLEITVRGVIVDFISTLFAFRKFSFNGNGFRLNGRKFFLRAVWDDLVFPGWGRTVPSLNVLKQRLQTVKELGFNTLFCAGTIPDMRVPLVADQLGLLLWYELPSFDSFEYDGDDNATRLLEETLRRDANSPSVVLMNLFSEAIPRPENAVIEWIKKTHAVYSGCRPVLLPGPAPSLRTLSACEFLNPESCMDNITKKGKPLVAWPIEPVPIPDMDKLLKGGVEPLGSTKAIISDMILVQSGQVLSEIARVRGELGVHGYLIRKLFESKEEKQGFFSENGHTRAIAVHLKQGDDWVGVLGGDKTVFAGKEMGIEIGISRMSEHDIKSGRVRCTGSFLNEELKNLSSSPCYKLEPFSFKAPHTVGPKMCSVKLCLESSAQHLWAENEFEFLLLPEPIPAKTHLNLGPVLSNDEKFVSALKARGYDLVETPGQGEVVLWSRFEYQMTGFFQRGGRGIFLFENSGDFPSSLSMNLEPFESKKGFLWVRSDNGLFSGITKKWIFGKEFEQLICHYYFKGVEKKYFSDTQAAYLVPDEEVFYPVILSFRLGHGMGLMCTFPLRKLCAEGDKLAMVILDQAIASIKRGGLIHPRFVPEITSREILVPLSKQGSILWRFAFSVDSDRWRGVNYNDQKWKRSRGAFGKHSAPGLVVRYSWETSDIYLRTWFVLKRKPRLIRLMLFHDRDIEIVINGRMVFRREGYTTDLETIDLTFDPEEILHTGKNLLAVHCHQPKDTNNLDVGLEVVY